MAQGSTCSRCSRCAEVSEMENRSDNDTPQAVVVVEVKMIVTALVLGKRNNLCPNCAKQLFAEIPVTMANDLKSGKRCPARCSCGRQLVLEADQQRVVPA